MNGGDVEGRDGTWPALESLQDLDEPQDLISPAQLLRYLDDASGVPADQGQEQDQDQDQDQDQELGDTSPLPRITRMPEGITVDERRVGRAVAQWILHVRCECGRRWFEVESIDTTTCPRCGVLVYVDVDARSTRRR
jgi:hypothetical protein